MDNHPTFPNSTITEAICEVRFELPSERPWKSVYQGRFFREVQDEYPDMEVVPQAGFQLEISGLDNNQLFSPIAPRTRYTHKSREKFIQISEKAFTVNIFKPYPGWSSVQQTVVDSIPKFFNVVKPHAITRIGLRYINQISLKDKSQLGGIWLNPGEYIASSILNTTYQAISHVDVPLTDNSKVIVNTARLAQKNNDIEGMILIFDIDHIVEKNISPAITPLLSELVELHDQVWHIFNTSKTDTLTRYLEGM